MLTDQYRELFDYSLDNFWFWADDTPIYHRMMDDVDDMSANVFTGLSVAYWGQE